MWAGRIPAVSVVRSAASFARWFSKKSTAEAAAEMVAYDDFGRMTAKNRQSYLTTIKAFESRDTRRRGHVEFIHAGLRRMEEFGVHRDLEVYRALLEVLPKGRFVATNLVQSEYMHFPKQQQCAINLLDQMEEFGVMPDSEMEKSLMEIFGKRSYPLRKFWRMMYWMPKFKNLSPWRLPKEMPDDALALAELAVRQITSVDVDMAVTVFQTEEIEAANDRTWLVSAQSPKQKTLLQREYESFKSSPSTFEPLIVRGRFLVRLKDKAVTYFTLVTGRKSSVETQEKDIHDVSNLEVPGVLGKAKVPDSVRSVHEQDDGTILSVCATGTSSRDSLLSWIRLLEKHGNPSLAELPVIFTLVAPSSDLVPTSELE